MVLISRSSLGRVLASRGRIAKANKHSGWAPVEIERMTGLHLIKHHGCEVYKASVSISVYSLRFRSDEESDEGVEIDIVQ